MSDVLDDRRGQRSGRLGRALRGFALAGTALRRGRSLLLLAVFLGLGQSVVGAVSSDSAFAKVGPELRALYEAYMGARERGSPFLLPGPPLQIVEDRVVVDAVASDGVEALRGKLVALGMRGAVSAGRIVSGQLPIAQIAAMAALPELRFARAAMATTR
jgi:hypothetical protein